MSELDKDARFTHWHASAMEATSSAWAEKRRLATAMRRVIDFLITSDAPEPEMRVAADNLERYAERLASHPKLNRYAGVAETANAGDAAAFFDQSPVIGLANPLAPPISLSSEGKEVRGSVTFGSAYEGPPGCVHGGWVAAAFDEVLGYAQSLTGKPGMTGTLTIRYRKPTPLKSPLRFEARIVRTEGRKGFAEGQLYAGDELTAEAEGIFITIDPGKFTALLEERMRRSGSQP